MSDVVVQGKSDVVGKEMLVQYVAVARVLWVVLMRRVVEVVLYVSMARGTA